MYLTFTSPKGKRQRLKLNSYFLNPFREDEILTFDVQSPWIAEEGEVTVSGYRVCSYKSSAAGRKSSAGAPMGFYRDAQQLRELLFADFPDFVHSGAPIHHPLVATIPEGHVGAGSIIVRHTGNLRSRDIPVGMRDYVEIEAYTRDSALKALQELGFVHKNEA